MIKKKTERILQFIIGFKRANDGNSPTLREICRACNVTSTSVARYHLAKLQRRGFIQMPKGGQCRKILVVGGSWNLKQSDADAATRHDCRHVRDSKTKQRGPRALADKPEDRLSETSAGDQVDSVQIVISSSAELAQSSTHRKEP